MQGDGFGGAWSDFEAGGLGGHWCLCGIGIDQLAI